MSLTTYIYVRASRDEIAKIRDINLYFPTPPDPSDVLNERVKVYIDTARRVYDYEPFEGSSEFVEMLSNYVVGVAIDPTTGTCNFDMAVLYSDRERGYLIRAGTRVYILEGRGYRVYPLIGEGCKIDRGAKVFYVLTGKREVRVVRSPRPGLVLIYSELIPCEIQVLRAVLVDENDLVELERLRR